MAPGTITIRRRVVRTWLHAIGDRWTVATWHDIDAYGDTRDISATTWRDEISHLHAFYIWAMRNEKCAVDPTVLVDKPRVGRRLPRPLSQSQYARLESDAPPAMRVMLELMAFCGLRCCEVARLRWCDVDLIDRVAMVRGKGDRDRLVGLPIRVVQAMAAVDAPSLYVLTRSDGGPHTPARVSQLVGQFARSRNVPVTAHQLRHTFATRLLERTGGEILVVQHALGHASVSTTQIYAEIDHRRAIEVAQKMEQF